MDCLKSFSFRVATNGNYTTGFKQWTVGLNNHYFAFTTGAVSSRYNIQGFKNIDVYGIDCVGTIQTLPNAPLGGVIVEDWAMDVFINGQQPLVGGNVTASPNFYSIDATTGNNNEFVLSKYNNSVKLVSPIKSVQYIELQSTQATGYGWQTLNDINIYWDLNFIVYYKFEGE
jgi:hypothetical protein